MRIVTVVLIAGILAVAGCKEDPEQAANKLLVETTVAWQQYLAVGQEVDATQYASRLELLEGIAANLEKIVTNYPESSLAVQLVSTGVAGKLSTAEVAALAGELSEKLPCLTAAENCLDLLTGPTLALAIETEASLEDSWGIATPFIVAAQARAGDIAGAQETVKSIEGAEDRSWPLAEIAGAQARAGDIAGAREAVKSIVEADAQALALAEIARAQAAAGDIAGAQETLKSVRAVVKSIAAVGQSVWLLSQIAGAQAAAGDIAGARETVKSSGEASVHFNALPQIARAQAAAGDIAGAQETLNSVRAVVKSIVAAGPDDRMLPEIAGAQAATGDIAGARETVKSIVEAEAQAYALALIAGAHAAAGDGDGAFETMTLAIDTAKGIEDAAQRANLLAVIVYVFNLARS